MQQTGELWDRRQHRIDYRGDVRLLAKSSASAITARATNLSEAGVFVATDALCDVGTEVVCDLPLATERLTIRGRVAWVRPERADRGMGIEFVDLAADAAHTLREVVGPARSVSERVRVRFEGMPDAVRAEALRTGEGISLRTALPFLRLNSPVEFCFGDEREPQLGWLRDVSLRASDASLVPRLQVEVVQGDPESEVDVTLGSAQEALADTVSEPIEAGEIAAGVGEAINRSGGACREAALPSVVVEAELLPPADVIDDPQINVLEPELGSDDDELAYMGRPDDLLDDEILPLLRIKSRPTLRSAPPAGLVEQLLPDPAGMPYELEGDPRERSYWDFKAPIDAGAADSLSGLANASASPISTSEALPGMDPTEEDKAFWLRSSPPRRRIWLWSAALTMAALALTSAAYTGFFLRVGEEAERWADSVKSVLGLDHAAGQTPQQRALSTPVTPPPASSLAQAKTGVAQAKTGVAETKTGVAETTTTAAKGSALSGAAAISKSALQSNEQKTQRTRASSRRTFRLRRDGSRIVLSVPIHGSLAGKRSYRLARPDGIAIKLPHARSSVRPGIYRLRGHGAEGKHGLRVLWIRRYENGVRLRVLFRRPTPKYRVEITRRAVRVICEATKLAKVRTRP